MTPKEKANELIKKFDVKYYYKITKKQFPVSMHDPVIKKCALIAVDEIINYLLDSDWALINNKAKYWEEVKQEIEKL